VIGIIEEILSSEDYNFKLSVALNKKRIINSAPEHIICSTCHDKPCFDFLAGEEVCDNSLSSYRTVVNDINIVAYGYLGDKVNAKAITKKLRNDSKGRSLKLIHFEEWVKRLSLITNQINRTISNNRSEVLHCFHDPVKWATQVSINSERMINRRDGDTFSERFKNCNTDVKAIYKCSQLLVKSVEMVEVYFNPDSAAFGDTYKANIYKIFDMVQAIIFHAEGKRYNKKFRLLGRSFRSVYMYESFHIIALSLIQNSIKYSKTSEIDITINDVKEGVGVEVVSHGPLISESELSLIFNKGFRGKYAKAMSFDGMGIGLYIAQEIAKVHNFTIRAESSPCNYQIENIPMAKNTFSFTVPAIGI
jgi:hypothetical protein